MIIARTWLEEYIEISKISSDEICKKLNAIGLEVDSYKEFRMPKNVVVGFVKSCKDHENSDHLHVCEVDVGDEVLQIVCGAKNVEAGQFVAVAKIGAILPGDFKIKAAKLRGVDSSGMICSASELGLPKLNDGIMVLDSSIGELKLGNELSEFEVFNDDIIEIELTPNRGDCLSIHGVARDLSAGFELSLKKISYNEKENLPGIGRVLSIKSNEKISASLQYKAIELKAKFRLDLKKRLRVAMAEISAKNEFESLLNYATYATGVLFRAYDFDKIQKDEKVNIEIHAKESGEYGVYCGDSLLSLVGISQSDIAKITDESKNILIEASYTDPVSISSAIGKNKELKNGDQNYRSTRGSEPNLGLGNDYLFNILSMDKNVEIYGDTNQIIPEYAPKILKIDVNNINKMAGADFDRNLIVKILKNLLFEVSIDQDILSVKVPKFRHDIENSHDICEEIVRIYGIDNLKAKPLKFDEKNRLNNAYFDYINRKTIRYRAVGAGFYECVHYVFDSKEELVKMGFDECKVSVVNPINNELDMLRPTLINHLLNSTSRNIKNSKKAIKLFEIGTVFDINGKESKNLAFVESGLISEPSLLNSPKPDEVSFLHFASLVSSCIGEFRCEIPEQKIKILNEFEQANIVQNGEVVGFIGRLDLSLEKDLDLSKTYICEIDFKKLKFENKVAKAYSKFPSISRDLSLLVPKSLNYSEIRNAINSLNIASLKENFVVDIYSDESLGENNSITIKLIFQDMDKTLEDEEITKFTDEILGVLKSNLGLELR